MVSVLVLRRKALGMSLRQLGELAGYNWGYLSRAERGIAQPGVVSLCKWSRALGTDFIQVATEAEARVAACRRANGETSA
jgi:transcriptional regulator with XRE-family HTH domain